ncbi:2-dehydro-3-deoxygalactonokinase [Martelella alba]|uniref:2-dehydro-3-deoxygalactonokinase n=1 Tax=Martelella alba TaxID=2590451 RepID=A0ABY2SDN1_9HYPH|nr:2-dehydro-3-deoxygalactonokinase [Martelella alba]TKI02632.1 2-dehydro-3-deoxygalactonokinase [Martelella alba]
MTRLTDAALIALDWGTSSLRAWCLDQSGRVLASTASPEGIMSVPVGGFADVFARVVAPWRAARPDLPALASGMIGSAQGWREAPYLPCPAGPNELARAMAFLPDWGLHIVPGVAQRRPANVMRGEETQIAGALAERPELAASAHLVLPGTHSKWVAIADGRITDFSTYMTGELFAVLRQHSILGRLVTPDLPPATPEQTDQAFSAGVAAARQGSILPQLFATRAEALLGEMPAAVSLDYLSGLLIGGEIASALAVRHPAAAPILIGASGLVARYRQALDSFGLPGAEHIDNTAVTGLWRIACAAGLVTPSTGE